MEVKNYFATDSQGNVLGSAQVYLYLAGTTTLATGVQNINGAALANPFASQSNGLVQFKAPDGDYDLRVVKPGREFTIRIQCFDGVEFSLSAATEQDIEDLEGRLTDSIKFENASTQKKFLATSAPLLTDGFIQTNSLTQPSVKLENDGSGNWTIMQGFTWVPETEKLYSAWDGTVAGVATVVIMRQGSNGAYEIKSAGISDIVNHGQDLGHAYYNDTLYLISSNPDASGVVVFTPPTVDGGPVGNVRKFKLFDGANWGLTTVNESYDSRHFVTCAWDSSRPEPRFAHVFDFKSLMDGPDGDRFGEFLAEVNIAPRDEYWTNTRNTPQSVTCDAANVYILTSADQTTDPKYLSAFDLVSGKRRWRKQLSVGLAKATARGTICEYEGMAWLPSNADGGRSLWIGIRMRNSARASNEMFLMPIHESGYGSLGVKAPGPAAIRVAKGRDIVHPLGSDLRFSLINETGVVLTSTTVTGGTGGESGGASRQRWLFPESAYFGTTASMNPATSSEIAGVNIFGALGRGVFSSTGAPTVQLQRQDATGSVMEFFASTAKVGGITVTSTATTYATSSDQTLKNDEGELDLESAYSVVDGIRWHSFEWKIDGTPDAGVFAQELASVYPRAVIAGMGEQKLIDVDGNPYTTYDAWSVDYSKLIAPIGRALQGALREVKDLKSQIDDFQRRLKTLENSNGS